MIQLGRLGISERLEGADEGGPPSSASGAAGVPDTVWKNWLERWTQRLKMESITGTQMGVSLLAAETINSA